MGRARQTAYYVHELDAWARSSDELRELLGKHTVKGREWEVQTYSYNYTGTFAIAPVKAWQLKPVFKVKEPTE